MHVIMRGDFMVMLVINFFGPDDLQRPARRNVLFACFVPTKKIKQSPSYEISTGELWTPK